MKPLLTFLREYPLQSSNAHFDLEEKILLTILFIIGSASDHDTLRKIKHVENAEHLSSNELHRIHDCLEKFFQNRRDWGESCLD